MQPIVGLHMFFTTASDLTSPLTQVPILAVLAGRLDDAQNKLKQAARQEPRRMTAQVTLSCIADPKRTHMFHERTKRFKCFCGGVGR